MKNRFTITMLTSFITTYLCLKSINLNIDKKNYNNICTQTDISNIDKIKNYNNICTQTDILDGDINESKYIIINN